jgi:hypothetical protein
MEISGDIMNTDDRERLVEWLVQHPGWFAGFQEDPSLPKSGFRTQGDVLFISGECAKMIRNPKIPSRAKAPPTPLWKTVVPSAQHQKSWDTPPDAE